MIRDFACRGLLAIASALCFAAVDAANAAEPATSKEKAAAGAASPEEVAADPGGVWTRFLAVAELNATYERFDALEKVGYDHAAVDADACREHAVELRDAAIAVPVSIALHRAAMLCADALGDAAMAERETAALASLAKHALTGHGDSAWRRPIPVLSPRDVYALVALLGYEYRYDYYRGVDPNRYLPLVVAVWDPEKQVERHLTFDFIDTTNAIDREGDYVGYPYNRHLLADAFIEAQSSGGETIGIDMKAMQAGFEADDPGERVAKLREGAARGGLASLTSWLTICVSEKFEGCADGLIDALLPLAEKKHGLPMTLLAMAYAEGVGVEKDAKAAEALLDAADRRWYRHGASTMYAALESTMLGGRFSDFGVRRLRGSLAAGNVEAEMMLVAQDILIGKRALTAPEIAVLERESSNGAGLGYGTLAEYYRNRDMTAQAEAALAKAAERGHAGSQRERALRGVRAGGSGATLRTWWPAMTAAAHGGDAYAMRFLANEAAKAQEFKRAANWLMAAVDAGDIDAIYAIGRLYEGGHPDVPGGLEVAIEMYESLAEMEGETGAEARRRLAQLAMQGRGMKRNPKRALAWLQADAERGDAQSQGLLGMMLVTGADGASGVAAGERWLGKAVAAGSTDTRNDYALWLHNRADSTPDSRRRAIALLREARPEPDDVLSIQNNLAWLLCVSAHDDTRDPAAGLAIARQMEDGKLDPAELDTVAACYAATGDHAHAARLQQRVIDGFPLDAAGKRQGGQGIFDRLELYRAGKAYIETVVEYAASAAPPGL
ncbi:MAG: tetratricopeptide repeat protein [Pseudomonadota bacterium]